MYQYRYPHPAVTTDAIVFTVNEQGLQVLLIKRKNEPCKEKWAIPGGFLEIDEELETGAIRELEEETGITDVYLEQLYTFGCVDRDPRERVITVAYLALIPFHKAVLNAGSDAKSVKWHSIKQLPDLAFDHSEIIRMAYNRLKAKVSYTTIALQLLPKNFTITLLQHIYESILQESMDKRNFRKQVLGLKNIIDTGKMKKDGTHRPAKLYKLKNPGVVEIIK